MYVLVLVPQLCPTICNPLDCSPLALLSMKFSRQEHWSGLPFPSPGDLPNSEIEPMSLTSPTLAGGFFTTSFHLGSPTQCPGGLQMTMDQKRHQVSLTIPGRNS